VTITAIHPKSAVSGVSITYLGYSDCTHGCPGSEFWTPATQADLHTQIAGTVPLVVPSGPSRWTLVFLEQAQMSVFQRHPCPSIHTVSMDLADAKGVSVGVGDGSPLFGIVTAEADESRC
jgi:hypothetical protein